MRLLAVALVALSVSGCLRFVQDTGDADGLGPCPDADPPRTGARMPGYFLLSPYPAFAGQESHYWDNAYEQQQYAGHDATDLHWRWTLPDGRQVCQREFDLALDEVGRHQVWLNVTADDGSWASSEGIVDVIARKPGHHSDGGLCQEAQQVRMCWETARTAVGEEARFHGSYHGAGTPATWMWDFGDNGYLEGRDKHEATHAFDRPGTYLIALRANVGFGQPRVEVQFTVD